MSYSYDDYDDEHYGKYNDLMCRMKKVGVTR